MANCLILKTLKMNIQQVHHLNHNLLEKSKKFLENSKINFFYLCTVQFEGLFIKKIISKTQGRTIKIKVLFIPI